MARYTTFSFWASVLSHVIMAAAAGADAAPVPAPIGMPNCDTTCGNMSVPYPFGLGPEGCYLPGFNLTCDRSSDPPRLLLGDGTLQVSEDITPGWPVLTVVRTGLGGIQTDGDGHGTFGGGLSDDGPYTLSTGLNEFILLGCNLRATLKNGNITMSSCSSFCNKGEASTFTSGYLPSRLESSMLCTGIGCCQAPIVINRELPPAGGGKLAHITSYDVELQPFGWDLHSVDQEWPPRVFVARSWWFEQNNVSQQLLQKHPSTAMAVPLSLDWEVVLDIGHGAVPTDSNTTFDCPTDAASIVCKSNHSDCNKGARGGYTCYCKKGYSGNPYIADGCQGASN
jgi:hypothetical protein